LFLKFQNVLPGEVAVSATPLEAGSGELSSSLCFGQFVHGFNGDSGIFRAVFNENHAATGFKRAGNGHHHFKRVFKLVVNIDEESQVNRGGSQAWITLGAQNGRNIRDAGSHKAVGKIGEHLGLDINGENAAAGANGSGKPAGEISGAGSNIGNRFATFQVQDADHSVGALFGFAFRTLEPIGAFMAHDACDFPFEKELADAIWRRGAKLVEVGC
jgi:hypothetical protein